jgi:hypothetical protein
MKLRRLVGQEPDLVDRQRLDSIVLPIVGVSVERSFRQQRDGECSGGRCFAEPDLADEQVRVRQPA